MKNTNLLHIQASGQRIEYFQSTQMHCRISEGFKIPLHSNVQWGMAFKMLNHAHKLCQLIGVFLTSANEMYGPITMLCHNNHLVKHIPWTTFKLLDIDWS